jgi:hypothetical protein
VNLHNANSNFHDFEKPIKPLEDQLTDETTNKVATFVDENRELRDRVAALELHH